MIKIGILGSNGQMAQALKELILSQNDCELSGFYGKGESSVKNMQELCQISDAIIDFTNPEITMQCLEYLKNKIFVCGTTGFNDTQINLIKKCGENAKVFLSSNMSIGVAIIQHALKNIVPLLDDFDVEIIEKHHNKKIDSPSGTALSIGKNIANIKKINFDKHAVYNRIGQRKPNEIGFASIRGGTVIGEHTVAFLGENESIEITHKAENRKIFALGAIKIAKILYNKPNNGFFEMDQIINSLIL